MADQVLRRYLELIEPVKNHYKFWEAILWSDNTMETHYGRIGTAGQTTIKRNVSTVEFHKKAEEKLWKGYKAGDSDLKLNTRAAPPAVAMTSEDVISDLTDLMKDLA